MSKESELIDPAGRCVHANIERVMTVKGYLDEWLCTDCRERFFHLDFSKHQSKIEIAEPYATLRDQFAMAAMIGMTANTMLTSLVGEYDSADAFRQFMAEGAYKWADALMEARKP